jgi:hypothetical protein
MRAIVQKMSLYKMGLYKMNLGALALSLSAGVAGAAEVRLIAVGGAKAALDKIIADPKETGNQVNFTSSSPPRTR